MIVPELNSTGYFVFKSPFQDALGNKKRELRVVAIRLISDMINAEESPYENIYKPVGLTEDDFLSDTKRHVPIITFVSVHEQYFYIPATYIEKYPELVGYTYQEFGFGGYLPLYPTDTDWSGFVSFLKEEVTDYLGCTCEIAVFPASDIEVIPEAEHQELVEERRKRESYYQTYKYKYEQLTKLFEAEKRKTTLLENALKNHANIKIGYL